MNKGKKNILIYIMLMSLFSTPIAAKYDKLAYEFNFNDLDGSSLMLSTFKNKVIVVINVASKCGFTNQYDDMQKIWEKYQEKGLIIIGVPSNDFGAQEPGSNNDIKNFCEAKFGISFPMTEKVVVKGDKAHPFYLWAKKNHGKAAVPKWNFHKIVIGKDGKVFETFSSITNPSSIKFINVIEKLL
jgi:glutathione peroxidase